MCNTHLDRKSKTPRCYSWCDRGQIYRRGTCAQEARRNRQREARRRYQMRGPNHVVSDSLERCIVIGAATPPRKFLAASPNSSADLKEPRSVPMSNAMHRARNDLPGKVIPCRPGLVTEMQPRPPLRQLRDQSRYRGCARIDVAEKPNLARRPTAVCLALELRI